MTTFMGRKTQMQLIADEDWFSTASCWTENPRSFERYLEFFTAFHNLYVGYLFHDFSRYTCVSRNPDWKQLFCDMMPHQGVLANWFSTLRQDIMSSSSTIKWPEKIFSLSFEAEQNFDDLQSQASKPLFSIQQCTAQRGKAMRSCGVIQNYEA